MYCKNCGRELEEGTRFCDRCGQSVRRNRSTGKEAKEREIQELKEERLNRQKRWAEQEKKRSSIKKARKKRSGVLLFFVAALIILLISILTAYILYNQNNKDKTINGDGAVALNTQTEAPVADATLPPTAMPTAIPSSDKAGAGTNTGKETVAADNTDYKRIFITDDVEFSYPSDFTKAASEEDYAVLGLKDSAGGAEVTVYESEYPGGTASALMKEYAGQIGGSIEYSRAGDGWYVITVLKNNDVYHRKYIFTEDDSVVYYDFKYPSLSSFADEYERYIDYMDETLGS